jgi:predicted cobalt transporter CbtA
MEEFAATDCFAKPCVKWHKILTLYSERKIKQQKKFYVMANIRHPLFLTGIIAILLHGISLPLRSTANHDAASYLMIAGFALMAICWVWGVVEVASTDTLQGSQRKFWLIATIAIPFVGAMFYHMMHSKRNTIVD